MEADVVISRAELRRLEAEVRGARDETAQLSLENASLRSELTTALGTIARLETQMTGLVTLGDNLQQQVADLKSRLGANSRNSSKPPSSDGPDGGRGGGRGKRTGRRRGGQPGREAGQRPLVPIEAVDDVIDVRPECCAACEAALHGDDPSPMRHQVVEIPDPRVMVTEYRLHALDCPACGAVTRAALPGGVGTSAFGPRLHAMVATLVGRFRQSKRSVAELLKLVWGIEVSLGAIVGMERRVATMLGPPVAEVVSHLQAAPSAHGDETSWRERMKRGWLWLGATTQVAVFLIRPSRSGAVSKELFGEAFAGVLCTDRWGAYAWIPRRALCWAHLLRDFVAMAERHGSPWHGERLSALAREILGHWRAWHRGEIDRETLALRTKRLRERFETTLRWTANNAPGSKARAMAGNILKQRDALWRFLDDPLVHPTNNLAERLLRYAVIYRKLSFGTDSANGSRYVERLLTAAATLSLQDRNLFKYLTDGMTASFAGRPAPSLLPTPAEA